MDVVFIASLPRSLRVFIGLSIFSSDACFGTVGAKWPRLLLLFLLTTERERCLSDRLALLEHTHNQKRLLVHALELVTHFSFIHLLQVHYCISSSSIHCALSHPWAALSPKRTLALFIFCFSVDCNSPSFHLQDTMWPSRPARWRRWWRKLWLTSRSLSAVLLQAPTLVPLWSWSHSLSHIGRLTKDRVSLREDVNPQNDFLVPLCYIECDTSHLSFTWTFTLHIFTALYGLSLCATRCV